MELRWKLRCQVFTSKDLNLFQDLYLRSVFNAVGLFGSVSAETPMDSSKSKYIFIYSFYTVNTVTFVILAYYQMQS